MTMTPNETHLTVHQFTPEALLGPLNEVEAKRAPKSLFVLGDPGLFRRGPRVSVVGSRKASDQGLARARKIAKLLVKHGAVVVSGLAEGIDTAAHSAAMEAGGKTIAVIGTPLDKSYPRSNRFLQAEIAKQHALLSEFPIGHPVLRSNFVRRNATMALIVSASIIVEAGDTSGALSQGWEALRLGRVLFIMNSVLDNPKLSWPSKMLGYGAQILSDDNLSHFLDELPTDAAGVDAILF
jgi:DNA processing protein